MTLGAVMPAAGLVPVGPAFPRQGLLVVAVVAVRLAHLAEAEPAAELGTRLAPRRTPTHVVDQPGGFPVAAGVAPGGVQGFADLPAGDAGLLSGPVAAVVPQMVGVQLADGPEELPVVDVPAAVLHVLEELACPARGTVQAVRHEIGGLVVEEPGRVGQEAADEAGTAGWRHAGTSSGISVIAGGEYGGAMGSRRGASIAGCGTGARTSAGKSAGDAGS